MAELEGIERIYEGWGRFFVAVFRGPGGAKFRREIEDHGSAAAVLPYDPGRRCATLVRQFRAPMFLTDGRPNVLEAVAGRLEEGEDPAVGVKREAMEEAGLQLGKLDYVLCGAGMPGISTEKVHLFLAEYRRADKVGEGGGLAAEHEDITIEEIALKDLAAMVDAGEVVDFKTIILIQTLRLRRPELIA